MKSFNYDEYRRARTQVNFLLLGTTVDQLQPIMVKLKEVGKIPAATLPCLAKLGLKMVMETYPVDLNSGRVLDGKHKQLQELTLKKAEL